MRMKAKKTEWYTGKQKPVRDGVYERCFGNGVVSFALYKNKIWRYNASTPYTASLQIERSPLQNLLWRGLAVDLSNKYGGIE